MGNRASFEYSRNFENISIMDLVVLMGNMHKGNQDQEIGFEDALRTIDEVNKYLQKFTKVDAALIESMLWSCTMMHEREKFWHPQNVKFEDFIKQLEKHMGLKVSTKYNFIKD